VASVVGAEAELESIGVDAASQRRAWECGCWSAGGELLGAGAVSCFWRSGLGMSGRWGCTGVRFQGDGPAVGYYAEPVEDAVLMRLCVRQPLG